MFRDCVHVKCIHEVTLKSNAMTRIDVNEIITDDKSNEDIVLEKSSVVSKYKTVTNITLIRVLCFE